jgi:hypothetical protein
LGKTIDRAAATDPAVLLNKRDEKYNLKGLNDILERTWTHDSLPLESNTVDENHCICLFADSYKVVDGRAIVSPHFKPGEPTPGINNYYYSNKRLETCVLRKLDETNLTKSTSPTWRWVSSRKSMKRLHG